MATTDHQPSTTAIRPARFPADTETARVLLREYEAGIGVSLCFQNFQGELAGLPGDYAEPRGQFLIAESAGMPAGCVALRPLDGSACEMKRLYVRPAFRGTGLGRRLADAIIGEARARGYRAMRLDTLNTMREAHALYARLGFKPIAAYNEHPVDGTLFMELAL